MQLIFLDRQSLSYKDHAYIGREFDITVDMVVPQKSIFSVNRESLSASVGDVAVLRSEDIAYIGIVASMTAKADRTLEVTCQDFREVFDTQVPAEPFKGDLCELLESKIRQALITNSDRLQNLPYLSVVREAAVEGALSYGEDSLISLTDLIQVLGKGYGITVRCAAGFLRGRFTEIRVVIGRAAGARRIRHDVASIRDLSVKETRGSACNKAIFYPKKGNTSHTETVAFYLLTDGTITRDPGDSRRFPFVEPKAGFYSDDEFGSLETKARASMSSPSADHQITFTASVAHGPLIPLKDAFLGDPVEFHGKDRTYETILTQIRYRNTFSECQVTLGEHRTSLTDRIKLMSSGNGAGGGVSVSASGGDIDGGIY